MTSSFLDAKIAYLRYGFALLIVSAAVALSSCGASEMATGAASAHETERLVNLVPSVPRDPPDHALQGDAKSQPQGQMIHSIQLTTEQSGWVLTDTGIWWTNDFTRNWINIPLPPTFQAQDIRNIFFLDTQHGWIVSYQEPSTATHPMDVIVFRTTDGGHSWAVSSLDPNSRAYAEPFGRVVDVSFVDAQHGWVMLKTQSSAAVSNGTLFRTTDGGVTWSPVAAPSGEPVRFINAVDGWTTNIPLAKLFRTHDGGLTWEEQVLPAISQQQINRAAEDITLPPDPAATAPTYALPTFFNDKDGVLAVTMAGEKAILKFYVTNDAGHSWQLASTLPTDAPRTLGAIVPSAAMTSNEWVALISEGMLRRTTNAGGGWQDENVPDLREGIVRLTFTTSTHGWAHSAIGQCAKFKTQCSVQTQLLITEDGGRTWAPTITLTKPD